MDGDVWVGRRSAVNWGAISSRTALIFLAAVAFFEVTSTIVFLAAAGFSPVTLNGPTRLVAVGERGADMLRVAALLDMFGYLSAVPLAIYLQGRFHGETAIDLFTLAGIWFLVLGSLGAVILAYAGAPLIREYATASAGGKQARRHSLRSRLPDRLLWLVANPRCLPGESVAVWNGSTCLEARS